MKESALLPMLLDTGVFLIVAALVVPWLRKIGVPSILGYLLVGICLGPFGLGNFSAEYPFLSHFALENTEHVQLLAEFGIILLLFVIGLELSPHRLWQMKSLVFGLGTMQVLLTASVVGGVAYAWGNSPAASTLLGLSLALSSTAIIVQWLQEQRLFSTVAGRSSFAVLLLQDLAVIPILFLLTIFSSDPEQAVGFSLLNAFGKMLLTVAVIYLVGQRVLRPLFVFANRHGGVEVFMALTLLVIVATATAAGLAGFSMALGAFLAGLLLADTEYRHEINAIIMPFKGLLLGIFFISFGMSINLENILINPFWIAVSVLGLMSIKAFIMYGCARLWKVPHAAALEGAILLSQAGEFGLLVVGSAVSASILDEKVGQFMLIVVAFTMMLTTILAPFARKLAYILEEKNCEEDVNTQKIINEASELQNHIILIGYGRMGKLISELLAREGVATVAFDNNAQRVNDAQKNGCRIFFGDACKQKILSAANPEKARAAIVTLDSPEATVQVVKKMRKNYPDLPLFVRADDVSEARKLQAEYEVIAMPEHLAISMQLAERVLKGCGLGFDQAHKVTEAFAKELEDMPIKSVKEK